MAAHQWVPVLSNFNSKAFITSVNNIFVHRTIYFIIFPDVLWQVAIILYIIRWIFFPRARSRLLGFGAGHKFDPYGDKNSLHFFPSWKTGIGADTSTLQIQLSPTDQWFWRVQQNHDDLNNLWFSNLLHETHSTYQLKVSVPKRQTYWSFKSITVSIVRKWMSTISLILGA